MILLIGDANFIRNRSMSGNSWENDLLLYLNKNVPDTQLCYTDTWNPDIPDVEIVYCFDCDRLREHFDNIIKFYHSKKIPIVLLANDLFHFDLVANHYNTTFCDAIVSSVKMQRLQDQFSERFPDKYIGGLNSQYVNTDKFYGVGSKKIYDIVIYGTTFLSMPTHMNVVDDEYFKKMGIDNPPSVYNFYPLRQRIVNLLKETNKYNVKIVDKPAGGCWECPIRGNELSNIISQGYLALATSSRSDRCMVKYFEISASDTVILGNIPLDFKDVFENNIVAIEDTMTDEEILKIIDDALIDKQKLIEKGKTFGKYIRETFGNNNTKTADEFIQITHDILNRQRD